MDERYAISRYEQAALLLPAKWQRLARQLPDHQKARAEELRLRSGQPMTVLLPEGEVWPSQEQPIPRVAQTDLEQLCDMATGYSRYAVSDTLGQGYLTAPAGFRIGVCGTAVVRATAATCVTCPLSAFALAGSRRVYLLRCCRSCGRIAGSAPR